jgi:hypothetical protein
MVLHEDPAEKHRYLRLFYRRWRPTLLGRIWTRVFAWMAGMGFLPQLLVNLCTKDRISGRLQSHVLVPVTYQGQRYLVSMLGEGSNWVRNVRATNGAAYIRRGSTRAVTLTEIPPANRAPILKAWCHVAKSGRCHLPIQYDAPISAFEAIAIDYPVFRIDPVPYQSPVE